jgi:serine/threonine protein kinase
MTRVIPFPNSQPGPGGELAWLDLLRLASRLRAAGAGHLAVDRFLGHTAVASLFLGHDAREGRPVTLKLIDSDLAYDVGAAEFVRGIGDARELADPRILPPGPGPGSPGAICYVSPYAPAEPLRNHLSQSQPIQFADALRIAVDTARALDHWHVLGLAHGDVRAESLLIQAGQVVLPPPDRVRYGWDARQHDVQALARFCLDLLDSSSQKPEEEGCWPRLRTGLMRAAEGSGSLALSAGRLAEKLTDAQYRAAGPDVDWLGPARRFLTAVRGWVRAIPGALP